MGYHILIVESVGLAHQEAEIRGTLGCEAVRLWQQHFYVRSRFVAWDRPGSEIWNDLKPCEIRKYGFCRRKLPKVAESDNPSIDAWHSRHRPVGKVSAACGALFGGLLADLMARCGQYNNIIQSVISWTDGHNQSKFGRCFKQRFGILVVLHRKCGRRATFPTFQHPSRCLPSHGRILVAQAVVLSLFFISFHFLSISFPFSHYFAYFGTILASGQSLAKLRFFFLANAKASGGCLGVGSVGSVGSVSRLQWRWFSRWVSLLWRLGTRQARFHTD